MATRKIDLMHKLFGKSEGLCKECCNYTRYSYRDKAYRKCIAYGVTASEATDWKASYQACGLFNREYNGKDVIRLVKNGIAKRLIAEPIEGQESLF